MDKSKFGGVKDYWTKPPPKSEGARWYLPSDDNYPKSFLDSIKNLDKIMYAVGGDEWTRTH